MQFLLRLVYPLPILTVYHEDETLGAGVVMSPKWPNLVLPSNVPDIETHVLVCYSLNVEANWGTQHTASNVASAIRHAWTNVGIRLPVGIVVTDWLSFNLYRIARVKYSETPSSMKLLYTYWSFRQHRDPTSTTASPCSRTASLRPT